MKVRRLRNDELCHYGTKGQKWGKRNYQNLDGTLTPAGRARYSKSGNSSWSGYGGSDDEEDMSDDNWFENKKKEMEEGFNNFKDTVNEHYENFTNSAKEDFEKTSRMERVRYNEKVAKSNEQYVKNALASAKKFTEESNRKMREQVANVEKTIDESVKTYGPIKSALKQPLQLFTTVVPAVTSAVDSGHYAKTAQKAKAKFRKETGVDHQYGRTKVKRR